jgi:hypothetical protein
MGWVFGGDTGVIQNLGSKNLKNKTFENLLDPAGYRHNIETHIKNIS